MKHAINFGWQFMDDYKEEYINKLPNSSQTIDIPHCAKEVPYNYFNEQDYQFVSTYQKLFDIEENISNKNVIFYFLFSIKMEALNHQFPFHFLLNYLF